MRAPDAIARLRRPEYTGDDRCMPCTAVNVGIAAALAVGLGVTVGPAVGVAAFAAALAVVYLRGYLVPGTPALTERYLPGPIRRPFGKDPIESAGDASPTGRADGDGADALRAAGVVAVRSDGDVEVTESFRARWGERARALAREGIDAAAIREAFDVDSASRTGERSFTLDGDTSVRWGSTAAVAADVAAAELLEESLGGWDVPIDRRRDVLLGVRLGLDACPACGGSLTVTEDRVDPCCQRPHLVATAVCDSCDAPIADAAVVDQGTGSTVRARLLGWEGSV